MVDVPRRYVGRITTLVFFARGFGGFLVKEVSKFPFDPSNLLDLLTYSLEQFRLCPDALRNEESYGPRIGTPV